MKVCIKNGVLIFTVMTLCLTEVGCFIQPQLSVSGISNQSPTSGFLPRVPPTLTPAPASTLVPTVSYSLPPNPASSLVPSPITGFQASPFPSVSPKLLPKSSPVPIPTPGLGPVLSPGLGMMSMLKTKNRTIVDSSGTVVQLRGVNLGGWFVLEGWMTPLNVNSSLPDTYSVIQMLDQRFGVAQEQSLINTYQKTWITTSDLDNIARAGFNTIRVPVWWGQFYLLNNVSNSGWRSDAFTVLDELVTNASLRGIYVILDMHGLVGGQSASQTTGWQRSTADYNSNNYWNNSNNQGNSAWMWWQIANHFKGNPTIAGYDLINEPISPPNLAAVWSAYSNLYNTIRSVDPDHMIFVEGCTGQWNWDMLPPPTQYNWTNVVYEMHEYQFGATDPVIQAGADHQVADFNNHASWNVPGYIGEFNAFGSSPVNWQYSITAYNKAGLSWTMWSYKNTVGPMPNPWGWYMPIRWPVTPNSATDSATTIQNDWVSWSTQSAFGLNLGMGLQPSYP